MASAVSPPVTDLLRGQAAQAPGPERKAIPVKWWAALGAAFVALQAYVLIYWIARGQATPTHGGADASSMPTYTRVTLDVMDIGLPILALATVYWFMVRPWRRERKLTTNGMLIIAWLSLYFLQDPLLNYSNTWFLYNSEAINWGSWTSSVPGWLSPNGHLLPEPILIWGSGYVLFGFLPALLGMHLLRWGRRRRPQMGKIGMLSILFAMFMVLDFFVELPFLTLGTYAYAGSIRSLAIFGGHTYQFPIYEAVGIAMWWTASACLLAYLDDKGRTFVERGAERMRFRTQRAQQGLKLLAILGFIHLMGLGYNVPMQWFATHSDPFPSGYKSYMLNGMCGPGSGYECGGPGRPIPRAD